MALHFTLAVNGSPIGIFTAQRRDETIPEDRVCTYDVTLGGYPYLLARERKAVVRHNYDAGAWSLVATALAVMLDEGGDGGE